MTSTTTVPTSLILTGTNNWFPWISSIKNRAVSSEIWDLIDPNAPEERSHPRPIPPTAQIAQQMSKQADYEGYTPKEVYAILNTQYNREEKDYSDQKKAIQRLQIDIEKSISANLNVHLVNCSTPYQALKSLKRQLAPTAQARYLDVDREYRALCTGKTKGQNVEFWLTKWQALFSEATEIKHPDFQTTMARTNFIKSTSSIDQDWSIATKAYFGRKENKGKSLPSFEELMQEVKQSYRTNEKTVHQAGTSSSFATLQGRPPREQSTQRNGPPTPRCPVEETYHWFAKCPYLNEASRPKNWTPNASLSKKAETLLKDGVFKEKVERAIASQKAFEERASNPTPSELPTSQTQTLPARPRAFAATYTSNGAPEMKTSTRQMLEISSPRLSTKQTSFCFPAAFFSSHDDTLLNAWILDSGSNIHLCNNRDYFSYQRPSAPDDAVISGKTSYKIEAFGTCEIGISTPTGERDTIVLQNVALVPGFMANLVSFSKANQADIHWNTRSNTLYTMEDDHEDHFCKLHQHQGHWLLQTDQSEGQDFPEKPRNNAAAAAASAKQRTSESPRPPIEATPLHWHLLMGHPGPEAIAMLPENTIGAKLIAPSTRGQFEACQPCHLSKAKKIISRRQDYEHEATNPLERIYYDLIPIDKGFNGHKWLSHFVCPITKYHWVWTHFTKGQATTMVERMIHLAKQQHGHPIKYLHSDSEPSLGDAFDALMGENGIIAEPTAPYTAEQNGLSERSGGVIMTKSRCMRIASKLPHDLWPEITSAAAYLLNRTPTKALGGKTPFEALYHTKPSLAHFHVFGCKAYPLIRPEVPKLLKLQQRAHLGYLVGYDSRNIFRVWVPSKKHIIRARNVSFDESHYYDPADIDLGLLLRDPELHEAVNVIDEEAYRPLADNQSLDEMDGMDLFADDKDADVANQLHDQISLPTPKTTTTISPTPTNHSYPILPTPPPSDASAGTPSVYTPATEEGEILGQNTENIENAMLSQNTGNTLEGHNLENGTLAAPPAPTAPPTPSWSYQPTTTPAPKSSEISSGMTEDNILPSRTRARDRRHAHALAMANLGQDAGYHSAFAKDLNSTKYPHRDDLPPEPKSWKALARHPHGDAFVQAAHEEYASLIDRGTFQASPRPRGANILPLIWVFKYKYDEDGYLERHKARLCVRGDLQQTEQETAAATLAVKILRVLMAMMAAFCLESRQYDAVNAFTNSNTDEEIYVHYPEGIDPPKGLSILHECLLLIKALYGLKRSPLLWLHDVTKTLERLGLHAVPGVECLFTNDWLIVFFYVDDFVMLYDKQHQAKYDVFAASFLSTYELRCLGELVWFIGIHIIRNRSTKQVWLSQDSYIQKVASKFPPGSHTPPKTPLPAEEILPYEHQATPEQIHSYQQRVGSISFAAITTRPDIAFASSRLAQFLQNPSPHHLALANRLIAYLFATKTLAIEYNGQLQNDVFLPASDAAFADDSTTRKSSFGYLFQLYGGPIDWKASKQITVTTSSTEAELLALSETARQTVWWNRFFECIRFQTGQNTTIICDNQQTLDLVNRPTPKLSTRLKHVDVHRCWLRQEVQNNHIATKWVPTAKMPADGLTKPLPRQKHEEFIRMLQLVDLNSCIASSTG